MLGLIPSARMRLPMVEADDEQRGGRPQGARGAAAC